MAWKSSRHCAHDPKDWARAGTIPNPAGGSRSAAARSVVVLPTRQDLAAQIGTVREVAARGLRHLEQLGCIRIESGRRAIVLDRRMLDRLVKNARPARAQ